MSSYLVLVANSGDATISTLALTTGDADATLESRATTRVGRRCTALAVDAARSIVHTAIETHAGTAIASLSLDRATGILTQLDRRATDDHMTYLSLAPGGGLLLGASYAAGRGAVWPLLANGCPGEPVASVAYANLHAVVTSPDGRHAYFASLGEDLIAQYALAASGELTPLDPPTVAAPAGSGPRHLIAPADDRVYVLTEFSGEAIRYERDPESGVLTAAEAVGAFDAASGLGHSVFGAAPLEHHYIWGADLHATADGRWLLCSERTESTLATIELDADGRLVRQAAITPTETQPRGFAITPDGRFVVAVGERSTQATVSRINDDGTLTAVATARVGTKPNWVRIVEIA